MSHCDSALVPARGVDPAVDDGARGMRERERGVWCSGGRVRGGVCTARGGRGGVAGVAATGVTGCA